MIRKDRLTLVLAALLAGAAAVCVPLTLGQQGPAADPPAANTADAAVDAFKQAVGLFNQKKFAAARTMVDLALKLDPTYPDAMLLKERVEAELGPNDGGTSRSTAVVVPVSPPGELLTLEQINRMRMFEMTESELKSVRGTISPPDLQDFWDKVILKDPVERAITAQDKAHFMMPGNFAGQLSKMREKHAITYFDRVKLAVDPSDVRMFKTHIQPYMLLNCATSGCHGGENAVIFRLYGNPGAVSAATDRETYTNLLVLSTVTAGGHGLVDRADPLKSLALQYLMPARDASQVHPKVGGKAVDVRRLSGSGDAFYKDFLEWAKSLAYPQPNYDLNYTITAKKAFGAPAAGTLPAPAASTRPK